jgi:hypothetical protein
MSGAFSAAPFPPAVAGSVVGPHAKAFTSGFAAASPQEPTAAAAAAAAAASAAAAAATGATAAAGPVKQYSALSICKSLFAGGAAGAISRTAVAPLERLKILQQARGHPTNGSALAQLVVLAQQCAGELEGVLTRWMLPDWTWRLSGTACCRTRCSVQGPHVESAYKCQVFALQVK